MFFIYIIYSTKLDRYYVGSCEELDKRLQRHNRAAVTATKYGGLWELKYSESFESRDEALKREHYIKKMKSRKYIESLIAGGGTG